MSRTRKLDMKAVISAIERMEHEKPRLVIWSRMDEFRLQVFKAVVQLKAENEKLKAEREGK